MTNAAPFRRALHGVGNGLTNLTIGLAVVFLGWCAFRVISVSQVHYPVTSGQYTYAETYCVSRLGGNLGSAYVQKPDLFGTTGPSPRLVIRCTFGPKEYLMKVVDLARSNETPAAGT